MEFLQIGESTNAEVVPAKRDVDYHGIILAWDGEVTVLQACEECSAREIFYMGFGPCDNGIDDRDLRGYNDGVYFVKFHPWSKQSYEGEWDGGVGVEVLQTLGEIPNLSDLLRRH